MSVTNTEKAKLSRLRSWKSKVGGWFLFPEREGKAERIRITDEILNIVFPARCPVCDEVLPLIRKELSQGICPDCRKKLYRISEPCCKRCGKTLESERTEYCFDCTRKHHEFAAGRALFQYKGDIKQTMYRFKYSNRREYAHFFAEEAEELLGDWVKRQKIQAIVPVPMYRAKERKRGYNQATDFAVELGKSLGIPVEKRIIERVRDTMPQKGLSEKERHENMKNAFHIVENIVKYEHILIVDDIYTTGSTIDAMADKLKSAGVRRVVFLCICAGRGI